MKKLLCGIFTMLSCVVLYAQELPKIIPTSPEAASIGKFIDIPVSLYTGVPNISVPIWGIKEGGISLPISIAYNSSGIKVEEIAPWVGTGWALNFGGGIYRTTRGLPDDAESGFLNLPPTYQVSSFSGLTMTEKDVRAQRVLKDNNLDYQPDIFSFSILGHSGKFFFNQSTQEVQFLTNSDVKIKPNFTDHSTHKSITSWTVTLPNGVKCSFGDNSAVDISEGTNHTYPNPAINGISSTVTAWHVTKIEDTSKRSISFSYTSKTINICQLSSQSKNIILSSAALPCLDPLYPPFSYTYYSGKTISSRISEITGTHAKIKFIPESTSREDLGDDNALKAIEIYSNTTNQLIKAYKLSYEYKVSYLGVRALPTNCSTPNSPNEISKRLFLKSIQEVGKNNATKPPYKFHYNSTNLPARTSFAQDYWGYYNGQDNSSLLPEVYYKKDEQQSKSFFIPGADRRVDEQFAKAGILEKIEYPTGGNTTFTYESNTSTNALGFKTDFLSKYYKEEHLASINLSDVNFSSGQTVTKEFTVGTNDCANPLIDKIFITSYFTCNTNAIGGCPVNLFLDGQPVAKDNTQGQCIELTPGKHTISIQILDPNANPIPSFHIKITRKYLDSTTDLGKVGGLRIKQIDFNPIDSKPFSKKYTYDKGQVLNMPVHSYVKENVLRQCSISDKTYYVSFPVLIRTSNTNTPLLTSQNNYVNYREVDVYSVHKSGQGNYGKTKNIFSFSGDLIHRQYPFPPSTSHEWARGDLLSQKHYTFLQGKDTILKETDYEYRYKDTIDQKGIFFSLKTDTNANTLYNFNAFRYSTKGITKQLISEETKEYNYNQNTSTVLTTQKKYYYGSNNHLQVTRTKTYTSQGDSLLTKMYYPSDKSQLSGLSTSASVGIDSLQKHHRIATPIQVESYRNNVLQSTQRTNFKSWSAGIILPDTIQVSKGSLVLEDRVVYHSYDDRGNPREVSKADGTKVYYVWGYDKTQPIAKIEGVTGASLSSSQQSLITAAITASNNDTNAGTEATLRTKLSALRNGFSSTPWVQVTTLTYDPLIGVTSITDARGNVMYYQYDDFNRLQYIKDKDGYVLKEHKYHYKN